MQHHTALLPVVDQPAAISSRCSSCPPCNGSFRIHSSSPALVPGRRHCGSDARLAAEVAAASAAAAAGPVADGTGRSGRLAALAEERIWARAGTGAVHRWVDAVPGTGARQIVAAPVAVQSFDYDES